MYADVRGWRLAIPLAGLAGGVAASLVVGGLAGLYPAARASRLPPAGAIRPSSAGDAQAQSPFRRSFVRKIATDERRKRARRRSLPP